MKKFMSKSGVRIADEDELYGIVTKCLGNGQLLIKIKDIPTERRCKIRGKFNKKNKDAITVGTWVLVGNQDYSTKQTECELLEIYTSSEIKKLKDMRNDWPTEFTGEEKSDFIEEFDTTHMLSEDNNVKMDIDFDDI
jgi:initiation factor 1A